MTTQEKIAEAGKIVTETRRACSVKHPHDICSACVTTMLAAALAASEQRGKELQNVSYLKDQDRLRLQSERDDARAQLQASERALARVRELVKAVRNYCGPQGGEYEHGA
jgi:hypothetical protein